MLDAGSPDVAHDVVSGNAVKGTSMPTWSHACRAARSLAFSDVGRARSVGQAGSVFAASFAAGTTLGGDPLKGPFLAVLASHRGDWHVWRVREPDGAKTFDERVAAAVGPHGEVDLPAHVPPTKPSPCPCSHGGPVGRSAPSLARATPRRRGGARSPGLPESRCPHQRLASRSRRAAHTARPSRCGLSSADPSTIR